ncbi:MAG TPA: ATP-binding SpoIIE family protein phosphatase, partial [Vicinamibacterales bacterium]
AEVRRAAVRLADRLAFGETDAGRVALIVSELATNLAKHAKSGEILLRAIPMTRPTGIEIVAVDKGPGMPNLAASRQDGYSTTGTLGHGLGALQRQSDFFEIYTHTSGTVSVARVWHSSPPIEIEQGRLAIGGVHVSKPGEDICGDDWDWRMRNDRLVILVADGLGHGLSAHDASRAAVSVFGTTHEFDPSRIIADVHAALRASRGAAVACMAIDLERGVARYCGVGNISGVVLLPTGARHSMVSHNGTAGHTMPRVQEFSYPVPREAVVVMHSDGVSTHWDLAAYPGLIRRDPSVIAGVLYRDFSRRRDDVSVVVAKEKPESVGFSEKQ